MFYIYTVIKRFCNITRSQQHIITRITAVNERRSQVITSEGYRNGGFIQVDLSADKSTEKSTRGNPQYLIQTALLD